MDPSLVDFARRGFERYNADGPSGFVDYLVEERALDPEIIFHIQDDLPNGGDWLGVEGWNEMMSSWLDAWEEFSVHPHEFIEASDEALIVPVYQRAVAAGSGMEIGAEMTYVLLYRDGRLAQIHLYSEREQADRAAAGWG